MHEQLYNTLCRLQELASAIKNQCDHSCVIIDILLELSGQDTLCMRETGQIPDPIFNRIDERLSFPPGISKRNFGRSVFPYLNFRPETYTEYLDAYGNQDESLSGDNIRTVLGINKPHVAAFLLGPNIMTWGYYRESLDHLIIEDDRTYAAARGYLVFNRLSFTNPLDLLLTSRDQKWQGWPKLWAYF